MSSGLSRRDFLAVVTGLAGAVALPTQFLGRALAQPLTPAQAPSTLLETIRFGPVLRGSYRTLTAGPGEPYITRLDLLGRQGGAARASTRRSLCYLAHLSDMHMIDAQTPGRLDPMLGLDPALWAGACRPQDALSVHVGAAMVEAVAAVRRSPLTGMPMTAAFVTGDVTDMHSRLELDWYITLLDGGEVIANSGAPNVYDGVQAWPEASYSWQPDDPIGPFGAAGFPRLPGMLNAAVSNPVTSTGLPVPWYAVYGNHDTTYIGTLPLDEQVRAWAVGDRKAALWPALSGHSFRGLAADATPITGWMNRLQADLGSMWGIRQVTPDPARRLFDQVEFMQAHLDSPSTPGPVGHGFTPDNVATGRTYWAADVGPFVRLLGLDTCNQVMGADGAVSQAQFDWLMAQLEQATADRRLAIVISHHNSWTLDNPAVAPTEEDPHLVHSEEFVAGLLRHPCLIAWSNGHTHINSIQAHSNGNGGGFWEITTASCIDFPQQQQTIEVVDNRDGTLSLFTTTLDHRSPIDYVEGDYGVVALASLSRQLSANDAAQNPAMRMGSPVDRNCELLMPAPFDLSSITDAEVETARAQSEARIMAFEQGLEPGA